MRVFIILTLLFVAVQCQSDQCGTNCTGGSEGDDLFVAEGYSSWGMPYVRNSQVPPIRAAHSSDITTAIIIIHGNNRDAYNYYCYMEYAVQMVNKQSSTFIVAPHFMIGSDGPASGELFWVNSASWKEGGKSDMSTSRIPSFQVLDDMITAFDNRTYFPGLREILIVGHSAGAQTAQRYAIATGVENSISVPVRYIVENAGSYAYIDTARAILPNLTLPTCTACNSTEIPNTQYTFQTVSRAAQQNCTEYNDWKMGLDNGNVYLNKRTYTTIRNEYRNKTISYLLGTADTCNTALGDCGCDDSDLDTSCDAEMQGYCRFQRGVIFYQYLTYFYGAPIHKMIFVEDLAHDGCAMITSTQSLNEMFPEDTTSDSAASSSIASSISSSSATASGIPASTSTSGKPSKTFVATVIFAGTCAQFDASYIDIDIPGVTVTEQSCTDTASQATVVLLVTVPASVYVTSDEVKSAVSTAFEASGYQGVSVDVHEGSNVNSGSALSVSIVALLAFIALF